MTSELDTAVVIFGVDAAAFAFARVAAVVPVELVAAVTLELDTFVVIFLSVAPASVFARVAAVAPLELVAAVTPAVALEFATAVAVVAFAMLLLATASSSQ